jgi:hypothetical protein
MKVEPSSPYTRAQLGDAERSGGAVKERIRTLGDWNSNLPERIWLSSKSNAQIPLQLEVTI